jgi:ABC-type sugar transport system ATPase subunit
MDTILKLSGISRSFGAIDALKGVDFEIGRGEVMGLVGENGAGKSTLVKIISGFDDGYTGTYTFEGTPTRFHNPGAAEQAGIAIAQQELSLIPTMSVAENIFLAGHNVRSVATKHALAMAARRFLDEVGLTNIHPATRVERLSVGEQHLVEVARLIAHDPKLLILDEPTAALGESDSIRILDMVKKLAAAGKSIIYVSHRLDEIFKITDRITVLRDGESQRPRRAEELNVNSLVEPDARAHARQHVPRAPRGAQARAAPVGARPVAGRYAGAGELRRLQRRDSGACRPARQRHRRDPRGHRRRPQDALRRHRFRRRDLPRPQPDRRHPPQDRLLLGGP